MDCLSILPFCVFTYLIKFIAQDDWWRIKRLNKKCYGRVHRAANSNINLDEALRRGMIETVLIKKFDLFGPYSLSNNLKHACYGGSRQLIRLIESKGFRDYESCLQGACLAGNMDLAVEMIDHGATDFHDALFEACHGPNIEVVQMILNHMKKAYGLMEVCNCGLEVVQLIINHIAKLNLSVNWNNYLRHACYGTDVKAVQLIIKEGKIINLDDMFDAACHGGNVNIIEFAIKQCIPKDENWNNGLLYSVRHGNISNVNLLVQNHTYSYTILLRNILIACKKGYYDIMGILIDHIDMKDEDWNDALLTCALHGNNISIQSLVDHCKMKNPYTVNQLNEALHIACKSKCKDTIKLLLKLGAIRCRRCIMRGKHH